MTHPMFPPPRLPEAEFTWQTPGLADWLVRSVAWMSQAQEILMTMQEQLQAELDRQTAAWQAANTEIQRQIQQVADLVAQLSTSAPPTQAQLDQLKATTDAMIAGTSQMAADNPPPTTP